MKDFRIAEVLSAATPRVNVCAVGAMLISGGHEPHDALMSAGLCNVVGFEPVAAEREKLEKHHGSAHRYLPYVIGDGTKRSFHVTNRTMTSSIYPPHTELLRQFNVLEELTRTVEVREVQTVRLDDVPDLGDIDFLKIDVQGATYDVLAGAPITLARTVAVHAEVEFVPMYRGERLFSDVDIVLRAAGFAFHRFGGIWGRSFKPLHPANNPGGTMGQILWADAIYVRDFMALQSVPSAKLLALAVILHEVYKAYDLCAYVLRAFDRKAQSDHYDRYMARVVGPECARRPEVHTAP